MRDWVWRFAIDGAVAVGGLGVALGGIALAFGGGIVSPDLIVSVLCTAPENIPCRPLTLECLFVGTGGLGAGLPAVPPGWGGFPTPEPPRRYAPNPPPGYQPPPPRSPQDALNDPEFTKVKEDWARDNADRVYPTTTGRDERDRGPSAADVLVESIRSSGSRR